jgi:pimeloyl-ACP methyl ester carboxylesterase
MTIPPERRRYLQAPQGQIHLREQGQGIPLLLIHQTPWSSLQYLRAAPLLAAQGFHTIAPDTPGYGLSDPPDVASISTYADGLVTILDGLGIARAAIAGHHTGAMIALAFAARHPDRTRAVAADNAPFYTAQERAERLARPAHSHALKADGSHFTDRWAFMRQFADPAMSDEMIHLAVLTYFQNALIPGPDDDPGHKAAYTHDLAADIAAIRAPTLIIASHTDPLHPHAARISALRPDFARAEFPGGTATVLDSPARWANTVGGFIAASI